LATVLEMSYSEMTRIHTSFSPFSDGQPGKIIEIEKSFYSMIKMQSCKHISVVSIPRRGHMYIKKF
jgi:hypothetical protein